MTWQNKGGDLKDYLRETIKEMKARITELETENRRYKEVIIPNLQSNRTKELQANYSDVCQKWHDAVDQEMEVNSKIEALEAEVQEQCRINGSDSDRSIAKEALDYLTAAIEAAQKVQPVIPDGMRLVPRKLSQPMKDVLTVMLTNCHTVEESYAELLAAAPEAQT